MNSSNNPEKRTQGQVIGIPVDVGSTLSTARKIMQMIGMRPSDGHYICVANVHMLTIAHENLSFRHVLEKAALVVADGMPLVWIQRMKGFKDAERVCGPDLMLEVCQQAAENNLSIYLMGSNDAVLSVLSQNLLKQFPNLKIAGTHAPDQLSEQSEVDLNLISKINDSDASILFVGLGCPKQEYWCATNAPLLNPLAIGVGAAFDFHAGNKKRPPVWMQRNGLEWLFRLASEPGRLWKRYLVGNSLFIYLSLIESLKRTQK